MKYNVYGISPIRRDNQTNIYERITAQNTTLFQSYNKFDVQWANNFKEAVQGRADGQRLITASNSLVTNRHTFAHGKMPTATFHDIKNYYLDVVELIRIFDSVVC